MSTYSLTHLSDGALLRDLNQLVAKDRGITAALLAHLAEVDARKLYLPAAYPSMYAYCVGELHFSEDAAFKRIRAARTARRFPAIFPAIADGRLHLSAVVLLTPYLTPENAEEMLVAAAKQTDAAILQILAHRFPRPDVPAQILTVSPPVSALQLAVRPVEAAPSLTTSTPSLSGELVPGPVAQHAPAHVERPRVTPLAPERYALQCTVSEATCQKLEKARALLGHQVGPKDLPEIIDRALDALIEKLEKRKFAKASKPRPNMRRSNSARHIPAEIKRRVWERDHGQCTFVSDKGQRCSETTRLEFDHVDPVARGGHASLSSIRLRCRAHNQFEADRMFGVQFMNHKRAEAQRTAETLRRRKEARAADEARRRPTEASARAVPS